MSEGCADRAVPNLPARDLDATAQLYGGFGFPRLHPVAVQDWGARVGYLVDIDGTQLHLIEER